MISVFIKNHRSYYFENSGRYTYSEMEIFVSLKGETSYTICEYLLNMPGASRDDIAEKVQTSCSTVSCHIGRLCDAEVLLSIKSGRFASYILSPSAVKIMSKSAPECFSAYAKDMFSLPADCLPV